jgi:hypothetical protein
MPGRKQTKMFLLVLQLVFIQFFAWSQTSRDAKVASLYQSIKQYNIECPKTVLAIAVFESGWLECTHCAYQYNNLFGFRANGDYLRFNNIDECLAYFKTWQNTYYVPWKKRHPTGTYYEYLPHVKYAHINIGNYVRTIKAVERLIDKDVIMMDESPQNNPSAGTGEKKE